MRTCATAFPREMWRQLVTLEVTLDNACKEALGGKLAELEAANVATNNGSQQIMRRRGIQHKMVAALSRHQ